MGRIVSLGAESRSRHALNLPKHMLSFMFQTEAYVGLDARSNSFFRFSFTNAPGIRLVSNIAATDMDELKIEQPIAATFAAPVWSDRILPEFVIIR